MEEHTCNQDPPLQQARSVSQIPQAALTRLMKLKAPNASMSWNEEYDIVCVGSGIGGLSTAIAGAHHGSSAIVIEKYDKLGGVTALSGGQLWPGPTHLAERLGIPDSESKAKAYIDHLSQGIASAELRENYFARARAAIQFFTETIGLKLRVIRGLPDYYYPAVPGSVPEGRFLEVEPFTASQLGELADKMVISPFGSIFSFMANSDNIQSKKDGEDTSGLLQRRINEDVRCSGAGLTASLVYEGLKRGVQFQTSTEVVDLVIEEGKVAGVIVRSATGLRRIHARRGVILSTGGYDWRPDFMRSFESLPESGSMALPTVTGDHIVLAAKAGAIPVPSRKSEQTPIFMGYKVPTEKIYGRPTTRMLIPGAPHSMVVNRAGKRFANDSFFPDVITKTGRFDGQEVGLVNWPAWLIFDQNMLDKTGLLPAYPGQPIPEGVGIQANSLRELAEAAGISADGLQSTVERLNGFCKTGVDEDFGRGTVPWGRIMTGDQKLLNPNLAEITRPPFYAVKLARCSLGVPTVGLPINGDGNVLTPSGNAVEGLYATGNSSAWQDWGGGFNSGVAAMRGMLYGYRAALHMTGNDGGP
jgi:3-oxosteroid 1-dehydrogenase